MTYALLAGLGIALISLVGVVLFGRNANLLGKSRFILPIAVGTFLSVVFFELIPEALHESEEYGSIAIATGFLFFYALSHILRTYHHHHGEHCHDEETDRGASLILIGDAVHNFADGIVIASAFLIDPTVGIVTTLGIALHEIPQEIAEYTLLIKAGYSPRKAALYNFLSASSVIVGILASYIFLEYFESVLGILIGLAAGNLLYIAASDILPNLHDGKSQTFWRSFTATVMGMVLMTSLLLFSHAYFGPEEEPISETLALVN